MGLVLVSFMAVLVAVALGGSVRIWLSRRQERRLASNPSLVVASESLRVRPTEAGGLHVAASTQADVDAKNNAAGDAIRNYISSLGLKTDDLFVKYDGVAQTVTVLGDVPDQATKGEIVLRCSEMAGVAMVIDLLTVAGGPLFEKGAERVSQRMEEARLRAREQANEEAVLAFREVLKQTEASTASRMAESLRESVQRLATQLARPQAEVPTVSVGGARDSDER